MLGAIQLDWSLGANVAAAARRARGPARGVRRGQPPARPALLVLPGGRRASRAGRLRAPAGPAPADLRRSARKRARHGGRERGAAPVGLCGRRLRPAVDSPLGVGSAVAQLRSSLDLLAKALPLLLVFANVLFLTARALAGGPHDAQLVRGAAGRPAGPRRRGLPGHAGSARGAHPRAGRRRRRAAARPAATDKRRRS